MVAIDLDKREHRTEADPETSGCSSSTAKPDRFERTDAVFELGKSLVRELELDGGFDTLGRWMAHHVAELIEWTEGDDEIERAERAADCRKAILDLWKHRFAYQARRGEIPTGEPILRTIASLDLEKSRFRHYPHVQSKAESHDGNGEIDVLLELAREVDWFARRTVHQCLQVAATLTLEDVEWAALARQVDRDFVPPELAVIFDLATPQSDADGNPPSPEQRRLADGIGRLESLIELAQKVAGSWRAELEADGTQD